MSSDGNKEMEALVAAIDGDEEFQLSLGDLVGKFRKRRERAILDMEAARLLPLGVMIVAERQGCCRATVYNRVHRARKSKVAAVG